MTAGVTPGMTSSAAIASFTVAQPKWPALKMRPKRSAESPMQDRARRKSGLEPGCITGKFKNSVALTVVRKHLLCWVGLLSCELPGVRNNKDIDKFMVIGDSVYSLRYS